MSTFFEAWQLTVRLPVDADVPTVPMQQLYPSYEELRAVLAALLKQLMYAWCCEHGVVDHYFFDDGKPRYDPVIMFSLASDVMRTARDTTLVDYQIERLSFEQLVE